MDSLLKNEKMKNTLKIIIVISVFFIISCKKEDITENIVNAEIQNIDGKWKLIEYNQDDYYISIDYEFNNVNNNTYYYERKKATEILMSNNELYSLYTDSTIERSQTTVFNEETNSFQNSSDLNIRRNQITKKTYTFSYNVEITKDTFKTTEYRSLTYTYDLTQSLYEDSIPGHTSFYQTEGIVLWDGVEINAGKYMRGKVISISDTEIILEEIISLGNKNSDSFFCSLRTYNDINNPDSVITGIITNSSSDKSYKKLYSKWQKIND